MNPYGITQFDAPAAIAAYDNESARRVAEMKRKQDEARAVLEQDRADKKQAVWAKFGGYQDAPSPQPSPSTPSAAQPSPNANPLFDPAKRDTLLREMTTLDPENAMKLAEGFSRLDKGRAEQAKEMYKSLGVAAFQIRQLPKQERRQAVDMLATQLEEIGYPRDRLANIDLSDRGLELMVGQIRDIEKLIDSTTVKPIAVPGMGIYPVKPASPYPQFDQQQPQAAVPAANVVDYAKAELDAGRMMTFDQAQAFGMEKAASLGVPIVRNMNGNLYFMVNGQWYDNPEGR